MIPGVSNVVQNAECCKRIASMVMGFDGWISGRSVRELGIEGMECAKGKGELYPKVLKNGTVSN